MTIELAPELTCTEKDHFDLGSLKAGSLVCRAWIFLTRSCLFRKITLRADTVLAFRNLLGVTPGCTFVEHVRSVHAVRHQHHPDGHVYNDIAAGLVGIRELNL
jgi:hypothetical protein